jgi:hypothetical protein
MYCSFFHLYFVLMKGSFLLVFLLATITIQAQEFIPGTIITNKNEVLEGFIRSDFDPGAGQTFFKSSEEGAVKEFRDADITKVVLSTKNAGEVTFVREHIFGAFNKISGPVWLQQLIDGPVSLYADAGDSFIFYDRGNFRELHSGITFYIKRHEEDAASLGAVYDKTAFDVNADRNFRKLTSDYLSDYPTLAERIRDREFGVLELPLVINLYNEWKGQGETLP